MPDGVLVLGMHRSGTSVATRALNLLGLNTCVAEDLLGPMNGNPTGLWESDSVVKFNDALLASMGRAWWCPPPAGDDYRSVADEVGDPAEARAIFRRVHADPWVCKDPRLSITLPFWRDAIGSSFVALVMLRHPLNVARSLRERDKFDISFGVALWERYNRLIVQHLVGLPVLVSTYDELVDDPVTWSRRTRERLVDLGIRLGDTLDPTALQAFIRPGLRHGGHVDPRAEDRFSRSVALFRVLEERLGPHSSFACLELEKEHPWVEAELVSLGHHQPVALPHPLSPSVSLISFCEPSQLADVAKRLVAETPPFCEVIVVSNADGPVPVPGSAKQVRVRVVGVHPHATPGAMWNAAAAAASSDILVFQMPDVSVQATWLSALREAFAAGYDAVCPQFATAEGGTGAGLTVTDEQMKLAWLAPSRSPVAPVPLLPSGCFAVERLVLVEIGGFDTRLHTPQGAATELSLRLWRLGHRCATTSNQSAFHTAPSGSSETTLTPEDGIRIKSAHLSPGVEDVDGPPNISARGLPTAIVLDGLGVLPRSVDAVVEESCRAEVTGSLRRPPVSIVVITRDEGEYLARTVQSLIRDLGPSDEVIVVDDGSTDGSTDSIESDRVRVIRGDERLGVARARRLGAASANGEVLVFSDAHVDAEPGWLVPLLGALSHPQVGAAGPALSPFDHPEVVAGGLTYTKPLSDITWMMDPSGVQKVPAICGCFFAMRRDVYDKVGGFDEAIGNYGSEDLELSLRLWRAGYQCVTIAAARVAHRFRYGDRADFDSGDHLYGLLRFVSTHLEPMDLAQFVNGARGYPAFPKAAARLLASDVGMRRLRVESESVSSTRSALIPLCPEAFGELPVGKRRGEGHDLVFVGGLHRSGTTFLAALIADHREASGLSGTGAPNDEGQHVQDVYPTARVHGGPGRFALDDAAHLTEEAELLAANTSERLFMSWAKYWDLTKRVLLEKSPPNLVRGRFLQAAFPGARFVMVKRHPVAVALSTRHLAPQIPMEDLLENWFAGWEQFEKDESHLGRALVVAYEDLCADPSTVLQEVGNFIGLNGLTVSRPIDPAIAQKVESEWATCLELQGEDWAALLSERFGEPAAAHGYELLAPSKLPMKTGS